ncbi:MAG: hypothetical protein JXK05_04990 [Campylobacterales bacterium]|nr:hypothetical protein [Campylobacterales bacterium]
MDLQPFERDLTQSYKHTAATELDERVTALMRHIEQEWNLSCAHLSLPQLKTLSSVILSQETLVLQEELQALLTQKERLERQIERKREALQDAKYEVFNAIEAQFDNQDEAIRAQVHQIKLQSLDLFDMLAEMVESAIITTLERGYEIEETIREIVKEITYETLSEGPLGAVRIRKVIATMLTTALGLAEASPNQAEEILRGTLRGIRSGLVRSLSRLKKQLYYLPDEAKHELIEDPAEPLKVDQLFSQMISEAGKHAPASCAETLERVSKEIHYDMQELVSLSKETMEIMRERFNVAVEKGSKVLNSKTAQEAKRMGISAWSSAKTALGSAIKTAKEKMDKNSGAKD